MIDSNERSWELSQLSVSGGRVRYPDDYDSGMNYLIKNAQESMKDKGKWSILIPMFSDDDINWIGSAKDKNNTKVQITYNSEVGLCIVKQ